MAQTLAVKYRPKLLKTFVDNLLLLQILEKKVIEKRAPLKTCYLFAGDSGCGKTTLARIFANKINKR